VSRALAAVAGLLWLAGAAAAQEGETLRVRLNVNPAEFMECANPMAFARGQRVILSAGGFAARAELEAALLQADAELPLGALRATERGSLNAELAIPLEAKPGEPARIRVRGPGAHGGPRLAMSLYLNLFADAGDRDGDGVKDMCDTCPDLASADQADDDADGAGNACDPCPLDSENPADGACANSGANP
jgi:hypothetical protein